MEIDHKEKRRRYTWPGGNFMRLNYIVKFRLTPFKLQIPNLDLIFCEDGHLTKLQINLFFYQLLPKTQLILMTRKQALPLSRRFSRLSIHVNITFYELLYSATSKTRYCDHNRAANTSFCHLTLPSFYPLLIRFPNSTKMSVKLLMFSFVSVSSRRR